MALSAIRFAFGAGQAGASTIAGARDFAAVLSQTLGQQVKRLVVDDYEQLLAKVIAGGTELAWMPPLLHARATRAGATLAVLSEREGARSYRSAIIVRADSPAMRLSDLRGARAAWSDPESAAGCFFPRMHLRAAGALPASETFVGSYLAACVAVAEGRADVAACFVGEAAAVDPVRALIDVERVYAAAAWRLRVLAVTDAIPSDGIVIASSVPAADAARYTEGLVALHEQPAGKAAIGELMSATRLVRPAP